MKNHLPFSVQMQLATISQEFSKIVQYEEDLQNQYRAIFLNLINIYLDSLVQQKLIEPDQKQQMSDEFSNKLKDTEAEWKNKISSAIQVIWLSVFLGRSSQEHYGDFIMRILSNNSSY